MWKSIDEEEHEEIRDSLRAVPDRKLIYSLEMTSPFSTKMKSNWKWIFSRALTGRCSVLRIKTFHFYLFRLLCARFVFWFFTKERKISWAFQRKNEKLFFSLRFSAFLCAALKLSFPKFTSHQTVATQNTVNFQCRKLLLMCWLLVAVKI